VARLIKLAEEYEAKAAKRWYHPVRGPL